jgi:hypothetical protein
MQVPQQLMGDVYQKITERLALRMPFPSANERQTPLLI